MNRKGDLFMLGLDILFLIGIIMIFWKLGVAFQQPNNDEGIGTRQTALLSTLSMSEEILLYLDTTATFAAYEAFDTFSEIALTNLATASCGQYAGYDRWTSPEKKCFLTKGNITENYEAEFLRVLRRMWNYPGMTLDITYDVTYEAGKITAITDDKITLPIVGAKKNVQQAAMDAIKEKGAIGISKASFRPDSALAGSVVVSPNSESRTGKVSKITILATEEDATFAIRTKYGPQGVESVHYVIDKRGGVTQLVPESERVACCGDAVAVALENDLIEEYPVAQVEKLKDLLADILFRNSLNAQAIQMRDADNPGPKFIEAVESQTKLLKDVTSKKSQLDIGATTPKTPEEEEKPTRLVGWPTESNVLTSCFGPRNIGDGFHDAIDIRGDGTKVFAFADGIIESVCRSGDSCKGGYGNNVMINHDGIYSRYNHLRTVEKNLKPNDRVSLGDTLGTTGSTGNTKVPHLDFKIYPTNDFSRNVGKNPLCYFDDTQLAAINFKVDCKYTIPLTRSDTRLAAECAGITPGDAGRGGCFESVLGLSEGGNAAVQTAKKNINAYPGLMQEIVNQANSVGQEPDIVLAMITQESKGRPDAVSHTGCMGLGQFCYGTANSGKYKDIFGPGMRICDCPGNNNCYVDKAVCVDKCDGKTTCTDEPRTDAFKSAKAIPRLLKDKTDFFVKKGYSDSFTFGVAAYNGGEGHVWNGIKATGKQDPTWAEVETHVKEETRTYVRIVMENYDSLGGNPLNKDQFCEDIQLTVKQFGEYSFAPVFSVEVPDLLSPLQGIVAWAEQTHKECNGEGDNRACLSKRKQSPPAGMEFIGCAEAEQGNVLATRFEQFVTDCKDNEQEDCACSWFPVPADDFEARLYENHPHVFIDEQPTGDMPTGRVETRYKATPEKDPSLKTLSLRIRNGEKQIVLWKDIETEEGVEDAFQEIETAIPVDAFTLLKDEELTWLSYVEDVDACGLYKTQFHVCARMTTSTYSEGTTVDPIVKFAMHLEDSFVPEPVTMATATTPGDLFGMSPFVTVVGGALLGVTVEFDPSPSEDISYYNIKCVGIDTSEKNVLARSVSSVGKDEKITDRFTETLECTPMGEATIVTITPYDMSGNEGPPVAVPVVSTAENLLIVS